MNEDEQISKEVINLIVAEQAWHYLIVPIKKEEGIIHFWIDENQPLEEVKNELEIVLNADITLSAIETKTIRKLLNLYYRKSESDSNYKTGETIRQSDDFLQNLIVEAKKLGSSDIHIETYKEKCRIRIRIDGQLIDRYRLFKSEYPQIINKIKDRARLDIAEKRLPQDGRIAFDQLGMNLDIRVSILPTLHGEKIVLRLLNNDSSSIDIEGLGFSEEQLKDYLEGIKKPNGIILISGPTGSGKTTTLYATLKLLNKEKTNILTIEDPIEYTLDGINQVALKESIGLTFASALRTFLRQDPDVIMVGEIRDPETAQMAIRAALTGHLVLSTVHTNSAWGTIARLTDMGIAPYLVASTLNTSVAQRLVRTLCPICKKQSEPDLKAIPKTLKPQQIPPLVYSAVGCENCFYTGYKGRVAIYEVISIDHELSEQIRLQKSDEQTVLQEHQIVSLKHSALTLWQKGLTSIEEVYALVV